MAYLCKFKQFQLKQRILPMMKNLGQTQRLRCARPSTWLNRSLFTLVAMKFKTRRSRSKFPSDVARSRSFVASIMTTLTKLAQRMGPSQRQRTIAYISSRTPTRIAYSESWGVPSKAVIRLQGSGETSLATFAYIPMSALFSVPIQAAIERSPSHPIWAST